MSRLLSRVPFVGLASLGIRAETASQIGAYDEEGMPLSAIPAHQPRWHDMNKVFSPVAGVDAPPPGDPRDPRPQSSHDNVTSAVRYSEANGVPSGKVMLGIAFHGRGFTEVSSRDAGLYSKYTGGFPETPWSTVESQFLTSPDWVRHWSATAEAPWRRNASRHVFITRDDPLSLGIKALFVRRQQLYGVMIWVLAEDDPRNCLLNALVLHLQPRGLPRHARH